MSRREHTIAEIAQSTGMSTERVVAGYDLLRRGGYVEEKGGAYHLTLRGLFLAMALSPDPLAAILGTWRREEEER